MKYDAFLSYSHAADDALAPALQAALHRLARPWYRMRALRVFRDKTSLAASPELWPSIVAALSEAEHFLLLASPPAAASRWVQREIEWWLANRSLQKMLILVTGGEVAWDEAAGDFDWPRTDALPAAVLKGRYPAEPLWVDLRWARSAETMTLRHAGFRLAVLDIAAPLHGRSKDELDGDDVRQFARTRRLAGSAIAGLVVLSIAAASAAVIAVRQRDEAVRQGTRAEAGRLAAQADLLRERGGPVDDSVNLAAQALQMLHAQRERSLEVDYALRRALAQLPRTLGRFEVSRDVKLAFTADARHATQVLAQGDQASVRALPGGDPRGCERDAIDRRMAKEEGARRYILVRAITGDGNHCATVRLDAGADQVVEFWQAEPLTRLASVPHRGSPHLRIALDAGAGLMAVTDLAQSGQPSTARYRIWSRARGSDLLRRDGAEFLAFAPDGRHYAATDGVWRLPGSADGGKPVRVLAWAEPPASIAFSPSGRHLARRTGYDGDVEIRDLDSGEELPAGFAPPGMLLALSDGGRYLAFDGGVQLRVWDRELAEDRARLAFEAQAAVFRGPDLLVLADDADAGPARMVRLLALPLAGAAIAAADVAAGEHTLWLGFAGASVLRLIEGDAALRIEAWDGSGSAPAAPLRLDAAGPAVWAVSGDGRHYAVARPDGILTGPLDGSTPAASRAAPQRANLLALSGRGEVLAAAYGATVQVWTAGGSAARSLPAAGRVAGLRLSDDGRYALAIVSTDDVAARAGSRLAVQRWRLDEASPPVTVPLGRALSVPDLGCRVSADGERLWVAGRWLPFGAAGASAPGDGDAGDEACAQIAGGGYSAALDERNVIVGEAAGGRAVSRLEHPAKVQAAALSADGRRAATVDDGGTLRLWALDPADLIAQACARGPRPLGAAAWAQYMQPALTHDACGRGRADSAGATPP